MDVVISALLQTALVLVLPFVWWLATARRSVGFFSWLGWKLPIVERSAALATAMIVAFLLFLVPALVIMPQIASAAATSRFHGLGWVGLPAVAAYALLQTSFTEESLFRGFLLKRIATKRAFWPANVIQAIGFALLHALPFAFSVNVAWGVAIGLLTGVIGGAMGYLNEQLAGGSLIPSWTLHAAANLLTGCLALAALT